MSEQFVAEHRRMMVIAQEARNIDYYTNALSVIPAFESNEDCRKTYRKCLEEAYEKMREMLHVAD